MAMDRPERMRADEARRLSSRRIVDPTKAVFPPLLEVNRRAPGQSLSGNYR